MFLSCQTMVNTNRGTVVFEHTNVLGGNLRFCAACVRSVATDSEICVCVSTRGAMAIGSCVLVLAGARVC